MTTNKLHSDRHPDDADAHETDPPESRVARAWDALEQMHDRVAELAPEASEQEIAAHVGDDVADTLIHDADQAAADDRVTAEEPANLRDDGTEVLLQGGVEDDLSIPLDENPITHVAEAGHDALLADAATKISREDADTGTRAAILLGRATEHIDRARLNVRPAHLRDQPEHPQERRQTSDGEGKTQLSHEVLTAGAMQAFIDRLEVEYKQQLAELLAGYLLALNTAEMSTIRGNEHLRNTFARAIQILGVDQEILHLGEPYESPYRPRNPEIAKRAMELEANAIQVNAWFQDQMQEIARATGSLFKGGPVKKAHRIAEKMENDYGEEHGGAELDVDFLASMIKDAVRCRLVVDGDPISADRPIVEKIMERGLHIAEDRHHIPLIKRGFFDIYSGEPLDIASGTNYRDTKVTVTVTVEVPTRDGGTTLCEIAIVTPEMLAAAESGHVIYDITRSMKGDDRSEVAILSNRLEVLQEAFYSGVSQEIAHRLEGTST